MNPEQTSTISLRVRLATDFPVPEEELDYLMKVVEVNLHDLHQEIIKAGGNLQWQTLTMLNQKLEALAINLKWTNGECFCAFMKQTIKEQEEDNLITLLQSLAPLIENSFSEF